MPVITDADIRRLAAVRSTSPIVSCYLDIDGARYVRPADYERVLDSMVRRVRNERDDEAADVSADLERIQATVRAGFDRGLVRSVAIFSCEAEGLYEVFELPVSVRNELVVNRTPAVGQLEIVVQQSEKLAVLLADKAHARVYVFRLGELIEHVERTDDLGRDYDTVGEHDRGGVDQHREELAHQHLRHAAELLWEVFQSEKFDHLVVAAPEHLRSELEGDFHPYLQERLRDWLDISPSASEPEIRRAAVDAERRIEQRRESQLVEELRDAVGAHGRGVAGIDPVLDALAERRVARLLVSDGYTHTGWFCERCDRLATVGRECRCGAEMVHVDDVVEEAVEEALSQSCHVDVCSNADLDVLGRIGALLRY